jgi:hypothetical protein
MAFDIDRLAPQGAFEPSIIDPRGKVPKQHIADRHLAR